MGRVNPDPPEPVLTIFGESEAAGGEPAKVSEAFASAAGKAIDLGLIEEGEGGIEQLRQRPTLGEPGEDRGVGGQVLAASAPHQLVYRLPDLAGRQIV